MTTERERQLRRFREALKRELRGAARRTRPRRFTRGDDLSEPERAVRKEAARHDPGAPPASTRRSQPPEQGA